MASHSCQSYFAAALLQGKRPKTALNTAAGLMVGGSHFRLWHATYVSHRYSGGQRVALGAIATRAYMV